MDPIRDVAARRPRIVAFVDGVGFWFVGENTRKRAGRLRRHAKRIGLDPGALYHAHGGTGFLVSLGPRWDVPVDLEARADGRRPLDILSLVELAQILDTRVTRLDVAFDALGIDARPAREIMFPSSTDPRIDPVEDLVRLRGDTRRQGSSSHGTVYARRRGAVRNACVYSDLVSKLEPDGPPVLHADVVRLRGEHVPSELRRVGGVRHLMNYFQPLRLLELVACHVHTGAHSARRSHRARADEPPTDTAR